MFVGITKALSRACVMIFLPCTVLITLSLLVGQARNSSVISFATSSAVGDFHLHLMDIYQDRMYPLNDLNLFCCPAWSPDGDEIIFIRWYGQGNIPRKRLFLMNANGSDLRPLTSPSAPDSLFAAWSPDGNSIVYVRMALLQDAEIAVLDTQTGTAQALTDNTWDDDSPQWSPDGRFIVFRSQSDNGHWEIYRMNPQGEEVQQLTDGQGEDSFPSISPDSRRIAFVSDRAGNPDLFVMNADGSDLEQITWTTDLERSPIWSPDGTRILFQSQLQGAASGGIYVIDAEGGVAYPLMSAPASTFQSAASWSPDGAHVLFMSGNATGGTDIFVMDADGNVVRQLTHNDESDIYPAWQPG